MGRWTALGALAVGVMVTGCEREDTKGQVPGEEEGAIPAGAIPAPTAGSPANPAAAGVPLDSAAAGDTAVAPADSVTPVLGR